MPCYHPLQGFRSQSLTKNGKRKLTFSTKTGYADLPVTVGCGQCIGCRLDRSRQWSIRLMHEAQLHDLACFVTLTYDQEPEGRTLVKSHFQSFMKRLRKRHGSPIRYFHCGEYGETTLRPHYHAILFGIDFADKQFFKNNGRGDAMFRSDTLDKIWGHGLCSIGPVTIETAAYVARYIMKKVTGYAAQEHYENLNLATGEIVRRQPEYITMSLKPAIGAEWFDRYASDVFPSDSVISRGKETGVPKYYTRRHLRSFPEQEIPIKYARIKKAAERKADNTPERLFVRETVKKAQIQTLKRNL